MALLQLLAALDRLDPGTVTALAAWARRAIASGPAGGIGASGTIGTPEALRFIQTILARHGPADIPPGQPVLRHRSRKSHLSRHRIAWEERDRLFSSEGRSSEVRAFLSQARERSRQSPKIWEVSRALGTSERALRRLSNVYLGHPPLVVLGLARAMTVANELLLTNATVTSIARTCGFSGKSSLTRHFRSFTGSPPETYRAVRRAPPPVRK